MGWRMAQPICVPDEIADHRGPRWAWKALRMYEPKTAGELAWVLGHADLAGMSIASVRRALRRLAQMGLIHHSLRRERTAKGGHAWKWWLVKHEP